MLLSRCTTVVMVAGTLALPGIALGAATSPDARDAAAGIGVYATETGLVAVASPDARDAASGIGVYATETGLIAVASPDARDAASGIGVYAAPVVASRTDLRSPDTKDAARGVPVGWGTYAPAAEPASSGIEWTDALIGAAIMLGLVACGAGLAMLVTHHGPRHTPIPH